MTRPTLRQALAFADRGWPVLPIRKLVRGEARTVSAQLRDAIAGLYDAWWDKRAPGRTQFERAAATVARNRAMAGDWCAAAALDDDWLDIPGYQPEYGWKPAVERRVSHPALLARRARSRRKDPVRLLLPARPHHRHLRISRSPYRENGRHRTSHHHRRSHHAALSTRH